MEIKTKTEKSLNIDTKAGTIEEGVVETKKTANSIRDIIKALTAAVDNEQITTRQAKEMRMNLGIHNSYFTKKRISKVKRVTKRKAQKLARKKNRA